MSPAASNVYPYVPVPCVMGLPVAVERLQELLLVLSFSSLSEDDKRAKRV